MTHRPSWLVLSVCSTAKWAGLLGSTPAVEVGVAWLRCPASRTGPSFTSSSGMRYEHFMRDAPLSASTRTTTRHDEGEKNPLPGAVSGLQVQNRSMTAEGNLWAEGRQEDR